MLVQKGVAQYEETGQEDAGTYEDEAEEGVETNEAGGEGAETNETEELDEYEVDESTT